MKPDGRFSEEIQVPQKSLIAIGGLSGSGKSTLSGHIRNELLLKEHDTVWIRSDIVRKELWGFCDYTDKLPPGGYSDEMTKSTFEEIYRRTDEALQSGKTVIADAVFIQHIQRQKLQEIAQNNNATFVGLWLEAPAEKLKHRVDNRFGDASDADSKIVDLQLSFNQKQISWNRLDASGTPHNTWRQASKILNFAGLDLTKQIEWHTLISKSLGEQKQTSGMSTEMQCFYQPFIHTVVRELLDGKLKGYSYNGQEPDIFADKEFHFYIPLKGPEGVCFDADELSAFTENFSMAYGKDFEKRAFETSKKAFLDAIRKTQPATRRNKVLKEIEFSCNSDDFEQEIGGSRTAFDPRPKFLH